MTWTGSSAGRDWLQNCADSDTAELVSGSKATIFCVSIRQNTSCSYLLRNFVIRLSIVPSHAALPGIPRCHGEETVQ